MKTNKSKIDAARPLLGRVTDQALAEQVGVTPAYIGVLRRQAGIKPAGVGPGSRRGLDKYTAILGLMKVMPDEVVAHIYGVQVDEVAARRALSGSPDVDGAEFIATFGLSPEAFIELTGA